MKATALLILCLMFTGFSSGQTESGPVVIETGWELVTGGCDFPEGPAYDGEKNLYFSNCYGRWITQWDGETVTDFVNFSRDTSLVSRTNGLAFRDGFLYACDYGYGAIIRFNQWGSVEVVSSGYEGKKFNRPNDLVFDKTGNIYFSDPKSYNREILDGRLFRIDAKSGSTELLYSGLGFPNGINFSRDGSSLYLSESAFQRVLKFEFNEDGIPGNPKTLIELPGGDPDGIEVDDEGNLYVAHFGGKAVYKITPDGEIVAKFVTTGKKPSNVEIVRDYLIVTECETNSVYRIKI